MNRCKRCYKILKNKKSIELGYGLSCAKKLGLIKSKVKYYKHKGISLIEWFKNNKPL